MGSVLRRLFPALEVRRKLKKSLRRRPEKNLERLEQTEAVVVSFPKSGRTWLAASLSRVCHRLYGTPADTLIHFDNFKRIDQRIPSLLFTHDDFLPEYAAQGVIAPLYKSKKVVFLARDPRDTAVSFYFHFAKRSTPRERDVYGTPEDLADIPLFDFMVDEKIGLARIITYMNRWAGGLAEVPQHLTVRYEDMHAEPVATLSAVLQFLGIEAGAELVAESIEFTSFKNLRAMEAGGFFQSRKLRPGDPADPQSFKVRRAKVGGYRDYFDPDQIARLDAMVDAALNPTFGYRSRAGGGRD